MCKAIEELQETARAEGRAEGKAEGRAEGMLETLVSLVKDGILSLTEAARRYNVSITEFETLTGIKA